MSLGELADPNSIQRAIEEFDSVGRDAFLEKYGFGEAKEYYLVLDGRRYDSKAIIGAAHGYEFPNRGPLRSNDFTGGTGVARKLQTLGFEVTRTPSGESSRDEEPRIVMGIPEALEAILAEYTKARLGETFGKTHKLWRVFDALRTAIAATSPIETRPHLTVRWGAGQGIWAKVPWIALLDDRVTKSIQEGVYCVYLFCQDMSGVYLTLNQGVSRPRRELGAKTGRSLLRDRAQRLRELYPDLANDGFDLDDKIDLRADPGLGAEYEDSTVAYKFYVAGGVPSDADIEKDLGALLAVYENYAETAGNTEKPTKVKALSTTPLADLKTVTLDFATALAESHVSFGQQHEELVRRFVASLATKPFVILTGLSGSGSHRRDRGVRHR